MSEEVKNGENKGDGWVRLEIRFNPTTGDLQHHVDKNFPHPVLVNELSCLLLQVVSAQNLMRLQQAVQQKANGIEVATQNQVPPPPKQQRRF